MTPQKIFDIVTDHLFTQGRVSYKRNDGKYNCAYRGADGAKCAVGILIPDDMYLPAMDRHGTPIWQLWRAYNDILPVYFGDNLPLLERLQRAHDVLMDHKPGMFLAHIGPRLLDAGQRFNLDTSKVITHMARVRQASNLPDRNNVPPDSPTTQG